jgi:hypothetical protein
LAGALDAAASALPQYEDLIRPANGDALRVLEGVSPEAARALLAWMLSERSGDAEELIAEWVHDARGRAALLSLEEQQLAKPGRKTLRRWVHRLRTQGVAVPEKVAPAPVVATLPKVEEEIAGAYLSSIDPSGVRMAYFLEPHPNGGARVFEVVFDDSRGIVGFRVLQAARGDARRFLKELASEGGAASVELPPESVRAAVAHALQRQPKDRPPPRGFAEWRSHVAVAGAKLPGELAEAAIGASVGEADLRACVALVEEGRVGPWPPAREPVLALVEQVRTDLGSPLVVSEATRRERIESRLSAALGEIFGADGAALAAHRFRESAYSFLRAGDEPAARACLAAARAFATGAAENPVARALLERPLRPIFESLLKDAEGGAQPAA